MDTLYQNYLVPLSIIWIISILLLLCSIFIVRNILRVFGTPVRIKQMESYCEGPLQSTARNKEGTIVPVVNYFEKEKKRTVVNKRRWWGDEAERQREDQVRIKENPQQSNSSIMKSDHLDSMKILEMQMEHYYEDDDEKILDSDVGGEVFLPDIHISPSETIIHQLNSRRVSTFSVPSISSRRPSLATPSTPTPLSPSYLPSRPVSVLWSSSQPSVRLYSYPHIERIVYPPGYVQDS